MTYDFRDAYLIPGWCYPKELEELPKLLTSSYCHVEIGTFCGKSLYASCANLLKGAQVYAVEPCEFNQSYTPDLLVPSSEWVKGVLNLTIQSIEAKRNDLHLTHLVSDSLSAAEYLSSKNIVPSTVYIDGNHNYEEVKNDITTWYYMLKHGGRMIGHDYWATCPGVIDAVEELFEGKANLVRSTRLWYVDKPYLSDFESVPTPLKTLVSSQY